MPRVLVADGQAGFRAALSRGLRAEDFDVATAAEGPQALILARTGTLM